MCLKIKYCIFGILVIQLLIAQQLPTPAQQTAAFESAVQVGNSLNASGDNGLVFNYSSIQQALGNGVESTLGESVVVIGQNATLSNGVANGNIINNYQNLYQSNNVNGALYNQAQQTMTQCQSKNDPACQAINKYNDQSTQQMLNAFNMGTSSYYYSQIISPDPNDSSCSIITTQTPVNPEEYQCIVGYHQIVNCSSSIAPYQVPGAIIPPDGTILYPSGSISNVCGYNTYTTLYQVPGHWLPDGAWTVITSSLAAAQSGSLPITLCTNSNDIPCVCGNGNITLSGNNNEILLVQQGNQSWSNSGEHYQISLYQEPDSGCDGYGNCSITLTLKGSGNNLATWNLYFQEPYQVMHKRYNYNDGCANYRNQ